LKETHAVESETLIRYIRNGDMKRDEIIRILITGGTIDKEYDPLTGELTFSKSHLSNMLRQVRCKLTFILEEVMLKDSLQMKSEDREEILEKCVNCPEDKIIVTHGTDTMVKTARVLGNNVKGKTVVLVGALIPYAFGASDALFNLGCAFSAVQALAPGVYITMNGEIFDWDNVRKNKESGEFEEIPHQRITPSGGRNEN
jgi:L-asparaginase